MRNDKDIMVQYTCDICEKIFSHKNRFESHKNRKRPCAPRKTKSEITTTSVVKPVLKWVGGKSQIIHTVLSLFPSHIKNYYEPFLGGGSVLLALLSYMKSGKINVSGTIYASDVNPHLTAFYKNIQSAPSQFLIEIKSLVDEFSELHGTDINRYASTREDALTSQESYYYWIRSRFNGLSPEEKTSPRASALFFFLNKTCFRGVYREGPHGFNVPFGHYKNPSIVDEDHIHTVSRLIQDVAFTTCSFTESLPDVSSGDFVYFDPPYAPESETSFVSYTSNGFHLEHHKSLFTLCHSLTQHNIHFLMSNADVKLVKDSFPMSQYTLNVVVCRRSIHSKKPESTTNELLISNNMATT